MQISVQSPVNPTGADLLRQLAECIRANDAKKAEQKRKSDERRLAYRNANFTSYSNALFEVGSDNDEEAPLVNETPSSLPISIPSTSITLNQTQTSNPSLTLQSSSLIPSDSKENETDSNETVNHPQIHQTFQAWKTKHSDFLRHNEIRKKRLETIEKRKAKEALKSPVKWERLNELDRSNFYAESIIQTGEAVAFSLNPSQIQLARACKAKSGPLDYLRRRVMRRLQGAYKGSPSFVVSLDTDSDGRLHLHGYIHMTSGDLLQLRDTLRLAAGEWKGRGKQHQVHLRSDSLELVGDRIFQTEGPLTAGWLDYACRRGRKVQKMTNHKAVYASPDLKADASRLYNAEIAAKKALNKSVSADLYLENNVNTNIDENVVSIQCESLSKERKLNDVISSDHPGAIRGDAPEPDRSGIPQRWIDRGELSEGGAHPVSADLRFDRAGRPVASEPADEYDLRGVIELVRGFRLDVIEDARPDSFAASSQPVTITAEELDALCPDDDPVDTESWPDRAKQNA